MAKKATKKIVKANQEPPETNTTPQENAEDIVLNCYIQVNNNDDAIASIQHNMVIPYALSDNNLTNTRDQFEQLFNLIIKEPIMTQISNYVENRLQNQQHPLAKEKNAEPSKQESDNTTTLANETNEFADPNPEPDDDIYDPPGEDPD